MCHAHLLMIKLFLCVHIHLYDSVALWFPVHPLNEVETQKK